MATFNVLLTGLSGAGKTTLALRLSERLQSRLISHEVLDGDVYRPILSPGSGYTEKERNSYRERIIYIAKLLNKHRVSCIMPFLSSSCKVRDHARQQLPNFIEVYVKCPLSVCMERDPKGLYRRAKMGKETNIVGIDIPYEEPISPEIVVETDKLDVETCVEMILVKINDFEYAQIDLLK